MILPSWCDDALVYDLPMSVRFRGITRRQGMLLHGTAGWGEWSPFPEYDVAEASRWLAATHEACTRPTPPALRDSVPVNVTVPAVAPAQAAAIAARAGNATAKVKVAAPGQSLADDVARVAAVREAMGSDAHVRIDANGAWSVSTALAAAAALAPYELEYIEQPCASVQELAQLRRRLRDQGIDVRIAADESIRRSEDPYLVRELEAADVAVMKVQPLGGIQRALRIAADIELPVVVSSALETSIGLWQGVRLAAALPSLSFACGLDTGRLLAADVVASPLRSAGGEMRVEPPPTPSSQANWCADAATARWWFERLHAAMAAHS